MILSLVGSLLSLLLNPAINTYQDYDCFLSTTILAIITIVTLLTSLFLARAKYFFFGARDPLVVQAPTARCFADLDLHR